MGSAARLVAGFLVFGWSVCGCGDDAVTHPDAGRQDAAAGTAGDAGGTEGLRDTFDEGHACFPGRACADCVAKTCCADQEQCGGTVASSCSHGPSCDPSAEEFPRHLCWLACLEDCVAREGDVGNPLLGDPLECSRRCGDWGPPPFEGFRPPSTLLVCIAPSLAGAWDDAGGADDDAGNAGPGCMAECFPSLVASDSDAGGS